MRKQLFLFIVGLVTCNLFAQTVPYASVSFDVISSNNVVKNLTLGIDRNATDGIDPMFGEVALPPYDGIQFDARFLLPDSVTTSYTDIRFGCEDFAAGIYHLQWENDNAVTIRGNPDYSRLGDIIFYDETSGEVLAKFYPFDSIYYQPKSSLHNIKIGVIFGGVLTPLTFKINSPHGGEILKQDSIITISYKANITVHKRYNAFFSPDNGITWQLIYDSVSTVATSFPWKVPALNSTSCRIRIGDFPCNYADNDGTFSIYTNAYNPADAFELPLQMKSGNTLINLTAGISPLASDGIDPALGESALPAPIPNTVDARFLIGQQGSLKDIRQGDINYIGLKTFLIQMQRQDSDTCVFTFHVPKGLIVHIKNSFGGGDSIFESGDAKYVVDGSFPGNQLLMYCSFDGTLPVELTAFSAAVNGNKVLLEWTTATETNNHSFTIERKVVAPGSEWRIIGSLKGKGTTAIKTSYAFKDDVTNCRGKNISYRLKQTDFSGAQSCSKEIEISVPQPATFELSQNFPNPFNPSTRITYALPEKTFVTLKIYDILGNEVAVLLNEEKPQGNYFFDVDLKDYKLASGVYFYQLRAGSSVRTKKMVVLK